jgi:hypothetical protein
MKLFSKKSLSHVSLAFALAFGLVACGGGGGGGTSSTSTSATTAAYVPGSAELGAFNALQTARTQCGFGSVTRNTQLDAAALAHAKYMVDLSFATGTSVISHTETPGVAGFTGADLGTRAIQQGYIYGALAEILEATSWDYSVQQTFPSMTERGASSIRNLMNTVYHLSGAMYEGRDVGMGAYLDTKKINGTSWREEYRFGALVGYRHTASPIALGAGQIATYPCDGITNIPPNFAPANESPNPFPNNSQLVGPPIYVKVDDGQILNNVTATVSRNGVNVSTIVLTVGNDPNSEVFANEVFVIPANPLVANSTYQVNLAGSVGAAPFTRNFSFSTGS